MLQDLEYIDLYFIIYSFLSANIKGWKKEVNDKGEGKRKMNTFVSLLYYNFFHSIQHYYISMDIDFIHSITIFYGRQIKLSFLRIIYIPNIILLSHFYRLPSFFMWMINILATRLQYRCCYILSLASILDCMPNIYALIHIC
ncbi:hypothetical protein ACJX0J_024343 [Zea mays]